jgi:hypothetical protein
MAELRFVRRVNRDSTTDSICLSCFRTIAAAQWESELDLAEERHVCDLADLSNVRELDSQRGTFQAGTRNAALPQDAKFAGHENSELPN